MASDDDDSRSSDDGIIIYGLGELPSDDDSRSSDDGIVFYGPLEPPDDDGHLYCDIIFDGASSTANPVKCGAGAIVRGHDGRRWQLRKGLGSTTITVAKYRGLILGMRFALGEGFQKINTSCNSILICNQVKGKWDIRNPNLIALNEEVQGLIDHFYDFTISHVTTGLNAEAAFQADQASYLPNGRTEYCESLTDDDDDYENGNEDGEKCKIEYDGASKGNPGKGGAGAIVRAHDGRIWHIRKGLGITTSNVAEYQGLILGMRIALAKGFQMVCVTGDSLLICNQVNGKWKIRNPNLIALNREVHDLKNKLSEFKISHVGRESNVEADFQANQASCLPDGEMEIDDR